MGLDTSHNCWHGPYSSFNAWRHEIARAAGLPPLDSMEGFGGSLKWESLKPDPLHELLAHSDCDGEIPWQSCGAIADSLERVIRLLPDNSPYTHFATARFIEGLRAAASAKENVEFH